MSAGCSALDAAAGCSFPALALIAEHEQDGRLDEAEALLARVATWHPISRARPISPASSPGAKAGSGRGEP